MELPGVRQPIKLFQEEKYQMLELNQRLESYLGRVKLLEEENKLLREEIHTLKKNRDPPGQRKAQEDALNQTRKMREEAWREKDRVEMEVENLIEDIEMVSIQRQKEKSAQAEAKRKLADSRKELEEERRAQIWLRQKVDQLEKDLLVQMQVHQENMETLQASLKQTKQVLMAPQTHQSFPGIGEEYSLRAAQNWKEATSSYQRQVGHLEESLNQAKINMAKIDQKKRENQNQLQNVAKELESAKIKREMLEKHMVQQRDGHRQDLQHFQAQVDALEMEKQTLGQEIDRLMMDKQNLLQVKMSLGLEVATYRALLDSEGMRTNRTAPNNTHSTVHIDALSKPFGTHPATKTIAVSSHFSRIVSTSHRSIASSHNVLTNAAPTWTQTQGTSQKTPTSMSMTDKTDKAAEVSVDYLLSENDLHGRALTKTTQIVADSVMAKPEPKPEDAEAPKESESKQVEEMIESKTDELVLMSVLSTEQPRCFSQTPERESWSGPFTEPSGVSDEGKDEETEVSVEMARISHAPTVAWEENKTVAEDEKEDASEMDVRSEIISECHIIESEESKNTLNQASEKANILASSMQDIRSLFPGVGFAYKEEPTEDLMGLEEQDNVSNISEDMTELMNSETEEAMDSIIEWERQEDNEEQNEVKVMSPDFDVEEEDMTEVRPYVEEQSEMKEMISDAEEQNEMNEMRPNAEEQNEMKQNISEAHVEEQNEVKKMKPKAEEQSEMEEMKPDAEEQNETKNILSVAYVEEKNKIKQMLSDAYVEEKNDVKEINPNAGEQSKMKELRPDSDSEERNEMKKILPDAYVDEQNKMREMLSDAYVEEQNERNEITSDFHVEEPNGMKVMISDADTEEQNKKKCMLSDTKDQNEMKERMPDANVEEQNEMNAMIPDAEEQNGMKERIPDANVEEQNEMNMMIPDAEEQNEMKEMRFDADLEDQNVMKDMIPGAEEQNEMKEMRFDADVEDQNVMKDMIPGAEEQTEKNVMIPNAEAHNEIVLNSDNKEIIEPEYEVESERENKEIEVIKKDIHEILHEERQSVHSPSNLQHEVSSEEHVPPTETLYPNEDHPLPVNGDKEDIPNYDEDDSPNVSASCRTDPGECDSYSQENTLADTRPLIHYKSDEETDINPHSSQFGHETSDSEDEKERIDGGRCGQSYSKRFNTMEDLSEEPDIDVFGEMIADEIVQNEVQLDNDKEQMNQSEHDGSGEHEYLMEERESEKSNDDVIDEEHFSNVYEQNENLQVGEEQQTHHSEHEEDKPVDSSENQESVIFKCVNPFSFTDAPILETYKEVASIVFQNEKQTFREQEVQNLSMQTSVDFMNIPSMESEINIKPDTQMTNSDPKECNSSDDESPNASQYFQNSILSRTTSANEQFSNDGVSNADSELFNKDHMKNSEDQDSSEHTTKILDSPNQPPGVIFGDFEDQLKKTTESFSTKEYRKEEVFMSTEKKSEIHSFFSANLKEDFWSAGKMEMAATYVPAGTEHLHDSIHLNQGIAFGEEWRDLGIMSTANGNLEEEIKVQPHEKQEKEQSRQAEMIPSDESVDEGDAWSSGDE